MDALTALTIIGVATVVGETVIRVARARAGGATRLQAHIDQLQQQFDDQASALAEVQSHVAGQQAHVRELQDRVDFTERLLTQTQDRSALSPGAGQGPGPA
jgi:uncharacterized coiled-coil protein SlyX